MADSFKAWSLLHGATVLGCFLLLALFVGLGRSLRGRPAELWVRRAWCCGIVLVQFLVFAKLPLGRFQAAYDLPLHYCDLAVLAGAVALWPRQSGESAGRLWRSLAWFWGLALSSQAFVTPILIEGPARLEFWIFWAAHLQVVGSPFYDWIVLGFRPAVSDLVRVCGVTLVWGLALMALDAATGWNYGFVGRGDVEGTILVHLPPWPLRVAVLFALACAMMSLLWLVGLGVSALRPARGSTRPDA